ncbi:MAG: hypothetical protein D6746_01940 [Bacteroidetes bacterium]|nr:MAG: hypothetical protein D6746_01940 [Bacteroidota bacterium]
MFDDDNFWDEERWEAYLRENDRRVSRFMDFFFSFLINHPLPKADDENGRRFWEAQFLAFLDRHGFYADEGCFYLSFEEEPSSSEGSLWINAHGEISEPDDDDEPAYFDEFGYRGLPVYQQALALAETVLAWANALPGDVKDSTLVQFCTNLTQIPGHIAKGYGIGLEHELIGGNIACVKRGLRDANAALGLLRELRGAAYLSDDRYFELYEQTYELRNALALYVQELRRRFELGID